MFIRPLQPLLVKEVMDTRALGHGTFQILLMCMCNSGGIVATSTQSPCNYVTHVENALRSHPVQDTGPQAIRTPGIFGVGRAVCCAWNVSNDTCPAPIDEFMRPLGIVGAMAIKAGEEENCGYTVLGASMCGSSNI